MSAPAARPLASQGQVLTCQNCEAPLGGRYCSNCGQEDRRTLPGLRELVDELLGGLFSYDARLWRSLYPLLLRPGYLTCEYLQGRRASYIPPVRLFLVFSLGYFLLYSFDFLSPYVQPEVEEVTQPQAAPLSAAEQINARIEAFGRTRFRAEVLGRLPTMVLLLLPFAAGLLQLFYRGPAHPYLGHLVFCLHAHAALFLVMSVMHLVRTWSPASTLSPALMGVVPLWANIYVLLALHRVHGQGWWTTLLKFAGATLCYLVLLATAFVATLVISYWRMSP